MAKEKKTPITIDDKEYFFEDLTQEQQEIINDLKARIETLENQ